MIYKTSLDNTAITITISVSILFAVSIVAQYAFLNDQDSIKPYFLTSLLLTIYFLSFAFRPTNYIVTPQQLVIDRLLLNIRIERADIVSVVLLDKKEIRGSIRTFGVGGLFGYYGKFAKAGLGNMTWYATRKDRAVLIKTTSNKKIILTPNDPDKFIAELTVAQKA